MVEPSFRFGSLYGDPALVQWANAATFSPLDRGCEGTVSIASFAGTCYRRKRYLRRSEFVRHCIGGRLLAECVRARGWDRHVDIPQSLAVDAASLSVLTRFVPAAPRVSDRGASLTAARTALLCAAGHVDALDPGRRRVATADFIALGIRDEEWLGLNGVDLSDANLIDDGARWWAIDF